MLVININNNFLYNATWYTRKNVLILSYVRNVSCVTSYLKCSQYISKFVFKIKLDVWSELLAQWSSILLYIRLAGSIIAQVIYLSPRFSKKKWGYVLPPVRPSVRTFRPSVRLSCSETHSYSLELGPSNFGIWLLCALGCARRSQNLIHPRWPWWWGQRSNIKK